MEKVQKNSVNSVNIFSFITQQDANDENRQFLGQSKVLVHNHPKE
jgi:hypothetical protein